MSRFGNPAFKTFYDKVGEVSKTYEHRSRQASHDLHLRIPNLPVEAIPEIEVYFKESWGNKQRVDYGSGMEFNLLCWL
jgi:serine/threonine-protein phosphatase 2A activator